MINLMTHTGGEITTESVQAAIHTAARAGETLLIPEGIYEVTSLSLPSGCDLSLAEGAELRAIPDREAWKKDDQKPLILLDGVHNVTIRGKGVLSASGWAFVDQNGDRRGIQNRPEGLIYARGASDIWIEGITLTETLGWTLHLDDCDRVTLDGILIRNPTYKTRKNSDGIDINGCRDVEVRNCDIETGDDGICLKNFDRFHWDDAPRREMRNIHVHHCRVASTCNATKIGTETGGDIFDVLFEDVVVDRHPLAGEGPGNPPGEMRSALGAISVQSNDCARLENITFRRYRVKSVEAPLFLLLQNRNRYGLADFRGRLSNVLVEDVVVEKAYRNSMLLAQPGMKMEGITLKNLRVTTLEKGFEPNPALPTGAEYPDCYNFGRHPAYGVYARGADLTLENCEFTDGAASGRAALDIL